MADPALRESAEFRVRWSPVLSDMAEVARIGRGTRKFTVRLVAALVAVSAIAGPWIDLALRSGGK